MPDMQHICVVFAGEWEGVTASFAPDGVPLPLDPHYVPDAFREWGVELFDWQTTVSSLASAEQPRQISLICRRAMPTVGCEADAIAYTEETTAGSTGPGKQDAPPVTAFTASGAYVAAPRMLQEDAVRAGIEVGLPLAAAAGEDKRRRLRVVMQLQRHWQTRAWQV